MKKALMISVAFNLLLVLGWAGKRLYYSNSAPSNNDYASTINADKCSVLQKLPISNEDIVLIGNSITERFPANEMFQSLRIKNRGIGSNLTMHVLDRIGPIAAGHPGKIFIEVGINDLAQKVPLDTTLENFEKIIEVVRRVSPTTQLFIQSVMPTTGPDQHLMPDIIKLNNQLIILCKRHHVVLVDMFDPFEMGGHMNKDLTTDGTHLNYTGYLKYKAILDLYIEHKS